MLRPAARPLTPPAVELRSGNRYVVTPPGADNVYGASMIDDVEDLLNWADRIKADCSEDNGDDSDFAPKGW